MSPSVVHDDYLLLKRVPVTRFGIGDLVYFEHAYLGAMVKRIVRLIDTEFVAVAGDALGSTASIDIGPVRKTSIQGRAVLRIAPNAISRIKPRLMTAVRHVEKSN